MKTRSFVKGKDLFFYIALLVLAVIFLVPYLWMMISSIRPNAEIFKFTYPFTWKTLIPVNVTLNNYVEIFRDYGFGKNLLNSLIVAFFQVAGTLLLSCLAGYVFSRIKFRGRELLFAVIMMASMIPFEVIMVPMYSVARQLGLTDKLVGIWLPWIANPLGIFLIRQAFNGLPKDFDEAAMVEGANHFQIFSKVLLPNIKPTLITLTLMSFLWSWNAFLWPLIVVAKPSKQLIQVAISQYALPQQTPMWGNIFAASAIATVPILILFIALQKYYISGAIASGIKG